jgi:DNA polymerase
MNSKTEELKKIRDEVFNFKESPLYAERVKNNVFPVLGEGSHDAKVMFIGEAPGKNEAATGKPFCGAAGRVLDELLASVNILRKDVYVTNIVKDRPPMNRDLFPDEIALYSPFLMRQIDVIQPKVIATLGRFSMQYILEKFAPLTTGGISVLHGQAVEGKAPYGKIIVLPLFHPAAALYKPDLKDAMKKDVKALAALI